MIVFPIVDRELRTASRRAWTFYQRGLAALAGVAGLVFCSWTLNVFGTSNFGASLFGWLSVTLYFIATLGGIYAASDALSAERRENTLGLLFLTELSNLDVVVGKLVSSSLGVIYALIALVPILAIPIMAGGVEWHDLMRTVLTTLNLLFFSLCMGMVASVLYQHALSSLALGIGLLCLGAFGVFVIGGILDEFFGIRFDQAYVGLSFLTACYHSFPGAYSTGTDTIEYWTSLVFFHVLGWVGLGFACWWVGRSWKDSDQSNNKQTLAGRWRHFRMTLSRQSPAKRREWLNINPYYWRASQPWWRSYMVWAVVVSSLAFYVAGQLWTPGSPFRLEGFLFLAWLICGVLKLGVCLEAPRTLATDRRSGALELVLSTPLHSTEVVKGQWIALIRHFRGPVMVMMVSGILVALPRLADATRGNFYGNQREELYILFGGMAVFIADMLACGRLGMARGIESRNELRAWAITSGLILIVPWFLFMVLTILSQMPRMFGIYNNWMGELGFGFVMLTWVAINLAIDCVAWRWANVTLSKPLQHWLAGNADKEGGKVSGSSSKKSAPTAA